MVQKAKNNKFGYDMDLGLDIRKDAGATFGTKLIKNAILGRILDYNLWYDDDYGYDLIGNIRNSQPSQYKSIANSLENELHKDDRIGAVTVSIENPTPEGVVKVNISGLTSDNTSFDLVGSINLFSVTDFIFQ